MEISKTNLPDCVIMRTKIHGDQRGFFLEAFNSSRLMNSGINFDVKQINFAKSESNVLRGLHFQKGQDAQAKIVGVIAGAVLDVVVDIRTGSPTYGECFQLEISDPGTLLLVPRGFAHGYRTLMDDTIFYYAVDNFYSPESEGGIRYDDPKLNINWGLKTSPKISDKDLKQPYFNQENL